VSSSLPSSPKRYRYTSVPYPISLIKNIPSFYATRLISEVPAETAPHSPIHNPSSSRIFFFSITLGRFRGHQQRRRHAHPYTIPLIQEDSFFCDTMSISGVPAETAPHSLIHNPSDLKTLFFLCHYVDFGGASRDAATLTHTQSL